MVWYVIEKLKKNGGPYKKRQFVSMVNTTALQRRYAVEQDFAFCFADKEICQEVMEFLPHMSPFGYNKFRIIKLKG